MFGFKTSRQKLADLTALLSSLSLPRMFMGAKNTIPLKMPARTSIEHYRHWVYICSQRNGAAVAEVPLRLYAARGTGQTKSRALARTLSKAERKKLFDRNPYLKSNVYARTAEDIEEIIVHPFNELIRNINDYRNQYETFEETTIFNDVTGNAYWAIETNAMGVPSALYLLPSQNVWIVPGKEQFIKAYLYGRNKQDAQVFAPEDIVHFREANPQNLWYGMGKVEASYPSVVQYETMQEYEVAMNKNMGVPPIVVQYTGGTMSEDDIREAEEGWNRILQGIRNSGKTKVTTEDFNVKEIAAKPREMGFLNGRKWTRLEIADAFGVPIALLDTENVNRANADAALYQYQKFTISPKLMKFAETINAQLIPKYNEPRLFCAFDENVPENEEFKLKQDDTYVKNGAVTINEVRATLNLDPVEWGDEPLQMQRQAQPVAITTGKKETPKVKAEEFSDEVTEFPGGETGGENEPIESGNERKTKQAVTRIFKRQEAWLITGEKDLQDDISDRLDMMVAFWDAPLADAVRPMIADEMKIAGDQSLQQYSLPLADWINSADTIKYIEEHPIKFARSVNGVTEQALRAELVEWQQSGEPLAKLRERVGKVFENATKVRADRIARTEMQYSRTGGTIAAWKDSDFVAEVEWDAQNDGCPFCLTQHGRRMPVGEAFHGLGDTLTVEFEDRELSLNFNYVPVVGPPLHPNCRCDLKPVFTEGAI